MHSSRMCTARSLPYGGYMSGDAPLDRDSPGQRLPLDRDLLDRNPLLDRDTLLGRDPLLDPWTEIPLLDRYACWTETPLDRDSPGQRPPRQRPPSHVTCGACFYSDPPNRITYSCKNITLPQTSFAGGNKLI